MELDRGRSAEQARESVDSKARSWSWLCGSRQSGAGARSRRDPPNPRARRREIRPPDAGLVAGVVRGVALESAPFAPSLVRVRSSCPSLLSPLLSSPLLAVPGLTGCGSGVATEVRPRRPICFLHSPQVRANARVKQPPTTRHCSSTFRGRCALESRASTVRRAAWLQRRRTHGIRSLHNHGRTLNVSMRGVAPVGSTAVCAFSIGTEGQTALQSRSDPLAAAPSAKRQSHWMDLIRMPIGGASMTQSDEAQRSAVGLVLGMRIATALILRLTSHRCGSVLGDR